MILIDILILIINLNEYNLWLKLAGFSWTLVAIIRFNF